MFCPKCRTEYREGFTKCSDCGVDLVAERPPEEQLDYEDWVTVLSTNDRNEVLVAQSALEGAGIPCWANGGELNDLLAAGPVEIQVPEEFFDEAIEALSEHFDLSEEELLPDDEESEEEEGEESSS